MEPSALVRTAPKAVLLAPRPKASARHGWTDSAASAASAASALVLSQVRATRSRRASRRRALGPLGVDAWRSLPPEIPSNLDVIMRNRFNDVVPDELDDLSLSPFRTLGVIRLPIHCTPQVGQRRRQVFRVGSAQHAALIFAQQEHGGFLGVAVDIPQATYLPRGCVGVEVVELFVEEDAVHVTLRGVSMLRILDRVAVPNDDGIVRPLMQEVMEHTELETKEGLQVLKETEEVERLFAHCGQLQKDTGIFHAGDFSKYPLRHLVQKASDNLADVNLCGVHHEEHRRPVVMSHAAVFAVGVQKRADFLCDPFSTLVRLRKLRSFLRLMDRVLSVRLHAKSMR